MRNKSISCNPDNFYSSLARSFSFLDKQQQSFYKKQEAALSSFWLRELLRKARARGVDRK